MILNQSWGIFFFFSDGMKRTLVSGYRSHFCVMVSDITVVPRLSDLFVLNCLKSYGQGYSDMPSRDLMQTNCRGCYLKIEKLWTSALLSDYLLWSFLQCPSDIKKKNVHSMNAEQMKGKVPLKLPHCGLEAVNSLPSCHGIKSPLHCCTDLPGKIIFSGLMWYSVLAHMLLQKLYCFGLGTTKSTASHFIYKSTGFKAGKTGKASKVTDPPSQHDLQYSSGFFWTPLPHFLYCQVELCGLMQESTEAANKSISGPLSVTIVAGVRRQ